MIQLSVVLLGVLIMSAHDKKEIPLWERPELRKYFTEERLRQMNESYEEECQKQKESLLGDVVSRYGMTMEEALSEGYLDLDDLI